MTATTSDEAADLREQVDGPAPINGWFWSGVLVSAWFLTLLTARIVGLAYVNARETSLAVGAVPWVGSWSFDAELLPQLAVAAIVSVACVWFLPAIAATAAWRGVLLSTAGASTAINLAMVLAGPSFTRWRSIEWGYAQHTDLVSRAGVASYLESYVMNQPDLGGHLRAHPPGFVLGLWGFEQAGLSGTGFHLFLMLAAAAVSTVAVLFAFRAVAGERWARGAAPFVVVAPAVVWHTNPDVVFGVVALVGVSMAVVSTIHSGRRRDALAIGGGLVFAAGLLLSYGVALLALPVLAVGLHRRAWRALALTAAGGAAGLLMMAGWGFWWLDGLLETREQYRLSLSRTRGYRYWLLGNAATYLALIGPATLVGLRLMRRSPGRVLVFGGLACPVLAGLSGLSSAETERIWQPFVPLVLLAGAALWTRASRFDIAAARRWLALQAAVALTLQATLVSPW